MMFLMLAILAFLAFFFVKFGMLLVFVSVFRTAFFAVTAIVLAFVSFYVLRKVWQMLGRGRRQRQLEKL